MSITTNKGGVLHELSEISVNVGGVLHNLDKVTANVGGVLQEMFSAGGALPDKLTWIPVNGTIKSVSDDGMSITGYITSSQQKNGNGIGIAQTNNFILPKGASVTLKPKSASGSGTSATICELRLYNGDSQIAYAFYNKVNTSNTPTDTYTNETGADIECYILLSGTSHTSGQSGATYYNNTVEAEIIITA